MKIGVLTYHRIVNSGAVVQAFAVTKILKNIYPQAQIEVIDLFPTKMLFKENRKRISLRNIKLNKEFIQKQEACKNFIIKNTQLSSRRAFYNNGIRAAKWIDKLNYDLVVVGSDTVWELRKPGYAPRGLNPYCLPYQGNYLKASISVSMDPINDIDKEQSLEFEERIKWIEKFNYISVRDKATLNFINSYKTNSANFNLLPDPTLIDGLDNFGDYSVKSKIPEDIMSSKKGGLSISEKNASIVIKSLSDYGFKSIDVGARNQGIVDYATPPYFTIQQVYAVHNYLDILITDRFHASIFTILQSDAPVFFFEDPSKWNSQNSKGRDLFKLLNIEYMVFRDISLVKDKSWIDKKISEWQKSLPEIKTNLANLREQGFKEIKSGLLGVTKKIV